MRTRLFSKLLSGTMTLSVAVGISAQETLLQEFHLSDSTGYNFKQPALSVSLTGNMAFSWEHVGGNGIWMKTLSAGDRILSDVSRVKAPFYHNGTWIRHSDSGEFMLVYAGSGNGWELFAQRYDGDGTAIGDTITLSAAYEGFLNWSLASLQVNFRNEYVVMYPGLDSVMAVRISEAGEFTGETVVLKPDMAAAYGLRGISSRSGELVLAWSGSDGNLFVRPFHADGNPAGPSVQVTELGEGYNANNFILDCDTTGNFVVAWEERLNDERALYSQLFSSSGEKVGNRAVILDPEGIYADHMSIAMDLDGKYVMAWTDGRRGDTTFIYLQQVDNTGEKVGGNYPGTTVNDLSALNGLMTTQTGSAIRLQRDTIYMVWQNSDPSRFHTSEIYAAIMQWRVPDATRLDPMEERGMVKVYPNPATGVFSVDLGSAQRDRQRIGLYNSQGILVTEEVVPPGTSPMQIDPGKVPAGLYYLRITGTQVRQAVPLMLMDR